MRDTGSNFYKKSLGAMADSSLMSRNQLIDSLTSHISLYTARSTSPISNSNSNSNSSPRSSILKWFSSLTVPQRQGHLTVVDRKFVQILIQMLGRVRTRGHGTFIILPDLLSGDLPSVCYRKSRGLLYRVAESNGSERRVSDSTLLFCSKEGDNAKECSVSMSCLDSVTVSEGFVGNVDLLVETMDQVSNGWFLRGEESELGTDWVELGWLKAKGYYSIEAFVANRLEVALRLAWLNCNNGKKRGVKLKEKVAMASVSANVFWRKNNCLDWWWNLDAEIRQKVWTAMFGKYAKALIQEILREATNASHDELWAFCLGFDRPLMSSDVAALERPKAELASDAEFGSTIVQNSLSQKHSFFDLLNRLLVLQGVITIKTCMPNNFDRWSIFFSLLHSVGTISDCILRKLRGYLMIIYLDSTKLELLGDASCSIFPDKAKEKPGVSGRRKKGKSNNLKRPNSVGSSCKNHSSSGISSKSRKDNNSSSTHTVKSAIVESPKMPLVPHGNKCHLEGSSSAAELESVKGVGATKGQISARKNKKAKRNRNSILGNPNDTRNVERSSTGATSYSCTSQEEAAKPVDGSDNSSVLNGPNSDCTRHILASESCSCSSNCSPGGEDRCVFKANKESSCDSSPVDLCSLSSRCLQASDMVENPVVLSGLETLSYKESCGELLLNSSPKDTDSASINEEPATRTSVNIRKTDEKSASPLKQSIVSPFKEDSMREGKKGDSNDPVHITSSDWLSHEWPNASSTFFPSPNTHLPPATDRLHLEVGHNWHNHFRQPYISVVHQTRNPPLENGSKQMLGRPLPMSLDWPPMVRSACGVATSLTCSFDSGFISRRQSTYLQGFPTNSVHHNAMVNHDEKKYSADFVVPDLSNTQELVDESDNHWISEEEYEVHGVSGLDYNQYFGGGVMYWNPSDHPGTGFSRPPSLSSDDSFWAWQEAEMNRAVDDMVAFSSSYSTNGLASPTAASFCSPFDPLVSGHQGLGYVVPGNDVPGQTLHSPSPITDQTGEDEASGSSVRLSGDADGKTGDPLPYPVLRPIIIPNMSRERPRLKSPCVPPSRRETTRVKRPPSPVVLCVPRAPRPPPPSPVGESRKHRGFPPVRSGSSSPRNWGMRGWYNDTGNMEESPLHKDGAEVVFPSWRNGNVSAHPVIQPLPGQLLQDHLIAISHLARDQEHPDVAFPLEPEVETSPSGTAFLTLMHSLLHNEIDSFCKQVAAENLSRKPYVNWAVKRVTRSLQVLWPRSRTNVFGSNATGLSLPSSDVDLVVCLPPVRNLEPIKEAGILEGRNGIKETCLQHAARYLANQEWVKSDSLKTVENTAIPIIMLVVEVPHDLVTSGASSVQSPKEETSHISDELANDAHAHLDMMEDSSSLMCSQTNCDNAKDSNSVRLDISFKSASHTGLQTTELVKELTEQFPAATPLALVLKQFLADRSLDQSYSGGLSSYCLVLLITRFLQHEHHLGRSINQNYGSLLMDFMYFFGNVFDPRQMRVSVRGSGLYIKRERGYSIDPIHIDDPLFPTNNVGRNCFRIHQCIKAFAEAYSTLKQEVSCLHSNADAYSSPPYRLLSKIIPSMGAS